LAVAAVTVLETRIDVTEAILKDEFITSAQNKATTEVVAL
jgi:hypothetical protein